MLNFNTPDIVIEDNISEDNNNPIENFGPPEETCSNIEERPKHLVGLVDEAATSNIRPCRTAWASRAQIRFIASKGLLSF